MKAKKFSEALGNVRDEYVSEAIAYQSKHQRRNWVKWCAMAACLLLIVSATFLFPSEKHNGRTVIANYEINSSGSYAVPEPGDIFFASEVKEAREKYADKDVAYLLAFDIFNGDGELSEAERIEEYQRLVSEGYELYTAEYWSYKSKDEKNYHTIVVGYFTESQLSLFKSNFNYGYFFHFVTNGDGSSIRVDKGNIITNFSTNHS